MPPESGVAGISAIAVRREEWVHVFPYYVAILRYLEYPTMRALAYQCISVRKRSAPLMYEL